MGSCVSSVDKINRDNFADLNGVAAGGLGGARRFIEQNMYAQCDIDSNQYQILESIIDHKKDGHAIEKADGHTIINGQSYPKKTTRGWHF